MPNHNLSVNRRDRIKATLFPLQDGKCAHCGRPMSLEKNDCRKHRYATLDHITPVSLGGLNAITNITLACLKCNSWRGAMPVEDFRRLIAR